MSFLILVGSGTLIAGLASDDLALSAHPVHEIYENSVELRTIPPYVGMGLHQYFVDAEAESAVYA